LLKYIVILIASICIFPSSPARAGESGDDLYMQGRFEEAEKAYSQSDMDRPKDARYRYNRGCAAYQNSDFQTAAAAFSSVLRRTKDKNVKFKSSYNLGNVAFRQGDFETAAAYYQRALLYEPENGDAGYNLELALREIEKQKNRESKEQEKQSQEDSKQQGDRKDRSQSGEKGKDSGSPEQDRKGEKEQGESGEKKDAEQEKARGKEQESPEDLSGELTPLQAMPEQGQDTDREEEQAGSSLDRKKAEALLDNLKEDRSRFLRFQVPRDKRDGVMSGKDW